MDYIFGMRAVIEALATGKDIDKILVKKDLSGDLSNELFAALKARPDVTTAPTIPPPWPDPFFCPTRI